MNAINTQCPPDAVLSDFGLGKLDAASAESVSQHLETCADCRQRVANLPGDSFVGRLRNADGAAKPVKRERTYVPGESMANAANSTDGSAEDGLPRPSQQASGSRKAPGGSPPSPSSVPPELQNHPDYELIKELGQGGMGTVYLAKNRMMDRPEVLKVISQAVLNKPGVRERFLQEIRAVANLDHPNIVAAYSVSRLGDSLTFAMAYVKGQNLEQVVKARGPLPVANAAFYIHQVANGLQHAHEKGKVHRDIKPNNLMLAIDGKKHTVKILDFGLAKAMSEKDADWAGDTGAAEASRVGGGLTRIGQMLGTPDYVAPEQTLDAHAADTRADIYSLGCTLYFLLSGGPPFPEASLFEILKAHHERDPKPLNLVRPEVPVELAAVVGKMMAKDPTKRYQTPNEVAKALVPFFKPGEVVAPPPGRGNTKPATDTSQGQSTVTPPPIPEPPPFPTRDIAPVIVLPRTPPPIHDSLLDFSVSLSTERPTARRRREWRPSLPPLKRMAAVAAAGAAAMLLLGVVFVVRTPHGSIEIELGDRNANVTVTVDGNRVDIAGLDEPLLLEVGEHNLKVTGKGFETFTKEFQVTKGANAPLTIRLKPLSNKPTGETLAGGTKRPNVNASKRFTFEIRDPNSARWALEGDELVQSSLNGTATLVFGRQNWHDFDFSLEAQRTGGEDHYFALWFGYQDDWNMCNYEVGGYSNRRHSVFLIEGGNWQGLASREGSVPTRKWYRIKVSLRSTIGRCFLDAEEILTFPMSESIHGRVGLRTSVSAYRFRNILVTAPDGKVLLEGLPELNAEPPVKSWEDEERKVLLARGGTVPKGADGQSLNLDFESGDLRHWKAEGDAFQGQPVNGDVLHEKYKYLHSRHSGKYWTGGDENGRDRATGTLTSDPFQVTQPYASFLVAGGGVYTDEGVELVRVEGNKTFFRAVGDGSDTLQPVAVDLSEHLGKQVFVRVADRSSGSWGRVSFDDFRFHETKPNLTPGYITSASVSPGTTINVLNLIDIDRDSRGGQWHWDQQHRLAGDN